MPQINLLSPAPRNKVTQAVIPGDAKAEFARVSPLLIKRSVICLVVGLVVWIILAVNIVGKEKVKWEIDEKVRVLVADPKEIENLRNERAALEKKVILIDELSSRKFSWYQKFALLTDILPEGIWFEEISFRPGKTTARGKPSAATGEQMEFTLKGTAVAYSLDDAISLIGGFVDKLGKNTDFAKDFEDMDFNTTKGSIGGLDIMKFEFTCSSK